MPHSAELLTSRDGLTLYTQCWQPAGTAVAEVVVVHGFTEHSGRYARLAESLNTRGYAVHALTSAAMAGRLARPAMSAVFATIWTISKWLWPGPLPTRLAGRALPLRTQHGRHDRRAFCDRAELPLAGLILSSAAGG